MKTSKMELKKIPFQKKFYSLYELEEDVSIVLNGLSLYAVDIMTDGEEIYTRIDFDTFTGEENTQYISPRYNPLHCSHFILEGFKLAICQTVEVEAADDDDYYYDNYFGRR